MSFLQNLTSKTSGNPYATKVGQLIEQSTDETQASENWAMYMEICDLINTSDEGPKDAVKAIKKRLSTSGKNYNSVIYTLTVLETCVKNCGTRFHLQIAHKDFLQEMVKIIGPKNDPPTVVQDKVLSLIQTWADAFQGQPELKEVGKMYQELKNKGIDFPMTDLDAMAPIHTPARSGNTMPASPPRSRPPAQNPRAPASQPVMMTQGRHPHAQHAHSPPQPAVAGPVTLGPDQLAKLKSELDVVKQNCRVFSEMLTELTPGQQTESDTELLQQLNHTCKQMQQRIMELLERVQNEEVTCELLHINDELNNMFLRYERFERLTSGQKQTSPQRNQVPPTYNTAAAMHPSQPSPKPSGDNVATANLIDFGDTPSPAPHASNPFVSPTQPPDISARLANMSVGSDLSQIPSTGAASGPLFGDSDEFDMFAQSRKSFEQSKQQLPGQGAYSAQQQDTFPGGFGSALNAKSTGNPIDPNLIDKEEELEEMEKWLKQNTNTEESASSSDFDRFLQERSTDTQNGRGTNRRQINKNENEDAMFAL